MWAQPVLGLAQKYLRICPFVILQPGWRSIVKPPHLSPPLTESLFPRAKSVMLYFQVTFLRVRIQLGAKSDWFQIEPVVREIGLNQEYFLRNSYRFAPRSIWFEDTQDRFRIDPVLLMEEALLPNMSSSANSVAPKNWYSGINGFNNLCFCPSGTIIPRLTVPVPEPLISSFLPVSL